MSIAFVHHVGTQLKPFILVLVSPFRLRRERFLLLWLLAKRLASNFHRRRARGHQLWGCNHFCWRCRSGKYSFIHRRQNKSVRSCTDLQERRYSSACKNTSEGNDESKLPQSSDIGVKAEKSSGESLTDVNGRVFIIHSTSTRKV